MAHLPIHPYDSAYKAFAPTGNMTTLINGSLSEEDAMTRAIKNSMSDHGTKQNVIVLMTPPPKHSNSASAGSDNKDVFIKRVVKRAYERSQLTTEVVDADDPSGSPAFVATSPFVAPVFNHLSNRKNKPAVADYINYFHDANPEADSQEAYAQASDFLRSLEGKPKKKRHNTKKRKTNH